MKEHYVPASVAEMPIKAYLMRAYPMLPEWAVRDALKKRDVRINGEKDQKTVRGGDCVRVYLPDKFFEETLTVLFENEDYLALEKPCGLPVDVDAEGVGEDTVAKRLASMRPGAAIAHRLDAGTGGVLLAGKNEQALEKLLDAFANSGVKKQYRAVVVRRIVGERLLEAYLTKDARHACVTVRSEKTRDAKQILTRYRALETTQEKGIPLTQLSVELLTGRTHQIRAHLAFEGMPLLGDDKYGDREINRTLGVFVPQLWCERLEYEGNVMVSMPKGRYFSK